jgi:hypothetical protein
MGAESVRGTLVGAFSQASERLSRVRDAGCHAGRRAGGTGHGDTAAFAYTVNGIAQTKTITRQRFGCRHAAAGR